MVKCTFLNLDIIKVILLGYFFNCVYSVVITSLRVPPEVQNGTGEAVVLDCEYTLRPADLNYGLVVKWFFNNGPTPVYQWIPHKKPQDFGILRGRLKLNYKASSHVATMHRAMYIVNPTTELTGEYKCFVSTFDDEDFMTKRMTVFSPEKRLDIVHQKTDVQGINISCSAFGIYPEPEIALIKDYKTLRDSTPMQGVTVVKSTRAGQYDISASIVILEADLNASTSFYCELRIPPTSYTKRKKLAYYMETGSGVVNTKPFKLVLWITLLTTLICANILIH